MNLQEKNQLKRIIQKEVRRSLQEQKMLEEGIIDMITSAFSSLGGGAVDAAQEQLATTSHDKNNNNNDNNTTTTQTITITK